MKLTYVVSGALTLAVASYAALIMAHGVIKEPKKWSTLNKPQKWN